jgi:hypothetical protein
MRRIALVGALLAGLAGGAVVAPPAARASCALLVVWHDRAYVGFRGGPIQASPGGIPVHGAEQPGCNDTVGANEGPTRIAARSIDGVPSEVAIVAEGHSMLGWGYFVEAGRDETRGCSLGGPVQITGPARAGLGLLNVSVDDTTVRLHHLLHGAAQIFPDGHTRFDGLSRRGFPYIAEGQRVRVDARFCKVPGSIGTKIVARRISPAGPIVAPSTAEDVLGADWRGRPGIVSRTTRGHALAAAIVVLLAALGIGTALVRHRRRSLPPGTG